MKPKLVEGTSYIRTPDGVFLQNVQNVQNVQRKVKIKGHSVSHWLDALTPYFDGRFSLTEMTQGLDPQRKKIVIELVDILRNHHFLKDVELDRSHTLSQQEQETYSSEIAFIDSAQDAGISRFEHFREQRLLVIGSGFPFISLIQALITRGIRQITAMLDQENPTNKFHPSLFKMRDARQVVQLQVSPSWDDETQMAAFLDQFDAILYIADQTAQEHVKSLNRLCMLNQKPFLPALFSDQYAWIGPLVQPTIIGCWECSWRRLQANLDMQEPPLSLHSAFQNQTNDTASQKIAHMIGTQMGFEVFKYFTQAKPLKLVNSVISIELITQRSQYHTFLPHPLCSCQPACKPKEADFLETIRSLQQGEHLEQDTLRKRLLTCLDRQCGVFQVIDEGNYKQGAMSGWRVVLSDPLPTKQMTASFQVTGVGVRTRIAKWKALLRACETYASRFVDKRRFLSTEEAQLYQRLTPVNFDTDTVSSTDITEWTWAFALDDRQAYLIPAVCAYPTLEHAHLFNKVERGIASGMNWEEAICRALLNLCNYLTLTQVTHTPQLYPRVDLASFPLFPEGTRQRHVLDGVAREVSVYDVTGPLQVPTFAICRGEKVITYSSGFDAATALREGMEQVMQHFLARQYAQFDYDIPAVPPLPLALRGEAMQTPYYATPQDWPDRQCWLQQILQREGWRVLVVPLNHDNAFHRLFPYIVSVQLVKMGIDAIS